MKFEEMMKISRYACHIPFAQLCTMIDLIKKTEETGLEHGATFCWNGETLASQIAVGAKEKVEYSPCPTGTTIAGYFHTHLPGSKQGEFSKSDWVEALFHRERTICLGFQEKVISPTQKDEPRRTIKCAYINQDHADFEELRGDLIELSQSMIDYEKTLQRTLQREEREPTRDEQAETKRYEDAIFDIVESGKRRKIIIPCEAPLSPSNELSFIDIEKVLKGKE